jgi:hypothetical protein
MVFRLPLPMKVGNPPFVAFSCLTIYECLVDVEDVVELVGCDLAHRARAVSHLRRAHAPDEKTR